MRFLSTRGSSAADHAASRAKRILHNIHLRRAALRSEPDNASVPNESILHRQARSHPARHGHQARCDGSMPRDGRRHAERWRGGPRAGAGFAAVADRADRVFHLHQFDHLRRRLRQLGEGAPDLRNVKAVSRCFPFPSCLQSAFS